MNNIKAIFEKVRAKFVLVVVIFLAVIALDTLVARVKMARELKNNPVTVEEATVKKDDDSTSLEEKQIENVKYVVEHDNDSALELLKQVAKIEYKEYDFGVFVESINGVRGDKKHFWSLYVNDEQSKVGVSEVELKQGDVVEWRYEEVKN